MLHLTIISVLIALVVARTPILDGRIIGGEDAKDGEFPYQLSLESYSVHVCGASILNPTRALTAAHCTDGKNAEKLKVRAGITIREKGGQLVQVSEIYNHPKYIALTVNNDVSVLKLAEPLIFSSTVQPIPIINLDSAIATGTVAVVSGWGRLTANDPSGSIQLKKVQVPKISQPDCVKYYSKRPITDQMMCFGYPEGGKDSCKGDSGGPLVVDGIQVGVVSFGDGCGAPKKPGVYTNLAAKIIRDHIIEHL